MSSRVSRVCGDPPLGSAPSPPLSGDEPASGCSRAHGSSRSGARLSASGRCGRGHDAGDRPPTRAGSPPGATGRPRRRAGRRAAPGRARRTGAATTSGRSGAGQPVRGDHDAADRDEQQVEAVRDRERRLGAQRAGQQQAEGRERRPCRARAARRPRAATPAGRQPRAYADAAEQQRPARPRRASTPSVLATSSPARPSGVEPSSVRTP